MCAHISACGRMYIYVCVDTCMRMDMCVSEWLPFGV
jgi:hypothetical protein